MTFGYIAVCKEFMAPNVWQVSCILLPRRYHGKGGQNTSGDGDVSHNDADRHTSEAWSKC